MRGLVGVSNQIERVIGIDLDGDGQVFRASDIQPTARNVALFLQRADEVPSCVVCGMTETRSAKAMLCRRSC